VILLVLDTKKDVIGESEIILAKYLKAFNSLEGNERKKCRIIVVGNKCDGGDWEESYFIN
jgi:hypothetical protein